MANPDLAALEALRSLFSEPALSVAPELIASLTEEPRGLWPGKALAVARPGSLEEAQAMLREAYARDFAIVPMGGNTGLVGGQTLQHERVLIFSTERLRARREVDPIGNSMTLSSGLKLQEAQMIAAEAGRLFPLCLSSEGSCTIGGNIATNAGGTQVLAYGNMRDLTLGVEAILPSGEVIEGLRPLYKDNVGYDLKHLLIGSEGTLGLVTAATLKLFARPRHQITFLQGCRTSAGVIDLFVRLRDRFGTLVTAAEIIPRIGLDFVFRHFDDVRDPMAEKHAWYGLFDLSGPLPMQEEAENWLAEQMERGAADDLVMASNLGQAERIWAIRHHMNQAQLLEGESIKHDITVPLGHLEAFIQQGTKAMEVLMPGARPLTFGHMGDGNLHFNLSIAEKGGAAEFLAHYDEVNDAIHTLTLDFGGSVAAEHGIGRCKTNIMPRARSKLELELYAKVKKIFDPKGLMNPGALLL